MENVSWMQICVWDIVKYRHQDAERRHQSQGHQGASFSKKQHRDVVLYSQMLSPFLPDLFCLEGC